MDELMMRRRGLCGKEMAMRGYSIHGSPIIADNIVEQNNLNFIYTPEIFAPGSYDSFILQTRVKYTDSPYSGTPKTWFSIVSNSGQGQQNYFVIQSYINQYALFIGNGASWNIVRQVMLGSFSGAENEWFLWRIRFNYDHENARYSCQASFPEISSSGSLVYFSGSFPSGKISFGGGWENQPGGGGFIDLHDTKIYLNNKLWWSAL